METQELSLDDRITNLQEIISIAEYELTLLLKQKEYNPVGFILWNWKKEWKKLKKK